MSCVKTTSSKRSPGDRSPHYEPFGWNHWPEQKPVLSYQFRRVSARLRRAAANTSPASRVAAVADRNFARGEDEAARGHVRTAMNCWLRAADYYRQAEFFLGAPIRGAGDIHEDGALRATVFLAHSARPAGARDSVRRRVGCMRTRLRRTRRAPAVPHLDGRAGFDQDEIWFMQARGALQRGISVLMIDARDRAGHSAATGS